MGMRIAKARHKCSPFAVEDTDFGVLLKRILVRNLTHGNDFLTWSMLMKSRRTLQVLMLAFNQHVALVRELSGCLQNADVQEEDPGLRMCASDFVFLGLEARVELDGIDIC
jgi:hypothetical protein